MGGKWKEKCVRNFEGSAGAMELETAVRLWERSVADNKLRYTTILIDGDSKAYDAVQKSNVHGHDVTIE